MTGVEVPPEADLLRAARRMVAYYGWTWLTAERLIARVRLQAAAGAALPAAPDRLCERAASEELHAACAPAASAETQAWQTGGYHDLGTYLTRQAHGLPPPSAGLEWADLVQTTLLLVYQHYDQCRAPDQFLAWAVTILRSESRGIWRKYRREQDGGGPPGAPPAEGQPPPSAGSAANPEGDQELFRVLRICLATDEERTLGVFIVLGLKRRELGMIFARPLTSWDELRRRVTQKLRNCAEFLALFERRPAAA